MNSSLFLPLLVELLIKSAAILLAAALVDRVWRRASAAQRHAIWLAAFVALLFLPATRMVAPHWSLAHVQPMEVRVRITNEAMAASASVSEPVVAASMVVPTPAPRSWDSWVAWLTRLDWPTLALYLWLAGAAAMLGRRALGSLRLRAMRRASAAAGDAQLAEAWRIAAEFGVTRPIALRVSPACRVPLTWGTLHPVLMLPEDAAAWPTDRLRAALRHELAHIWRGDYAMRLFADFVRALYWPNPLVWFASRALRTAQEQACDDLVLNAGTCPTDYATLLCEAARRCLAPHGAVAMAQPSTLESRIRAIVDATRDRRPLTIRAAVLASAFVALALAASTAAQLRAAEQTPAPAATPESLIETSSKDQQPRIQIETGLLEYFPTDEEAAAVAKFWTNAKPGEEPSAHRVMVRVLSRGDAPITFGKHFNLLHNESLTTGSGQPAVADVVTDALQCPTEWEKGGAPGMWKPTKFETRKCGLRIEANPMLKSDGTIDLDLVAQLNGFKEFIDKDTGRPLSAGGDPAAEGPRRQPVIASRKITTSFTLKKGDELVVDLSGPGAINPFTKEVSKGQMVLFVRSFVIPSDAEKAAAPAAPAPPPALSAPTVIPPSPEPAPPAPKPEPPQIEIEARFVQVIPGTAKAGVPSAKPAPLVPKADLRHSDNAIDRLLFDQNASFEGGGALFQSFLADARKKKSAVDVLAMPKVTTKVGQRAVIEIIRERHYATEWKRGTTRDAWQATAFARKDVGTIFQVEPTLQADGTIALDLVPQVVDFLGYENLDTGKPMPPGTEDSLLPQVWSTSATRMTPLPIANAAIPEGPRLKAVFSDLKLKTKVVLKPGATIQLEPLQQTEEVKPFADRVRKERLTVFVTASVIDSAGNPLRWYEVPIPQTPASGDPAGHPLPAAK